MSANSVTCVFVHGWAMNSAVWDKCLTDLPEWINVIVLDLPGHGSMSEISAKTLDDFVQVLHPLVHRPVLWVGWSLGGLAVLRLAELYPQRVAAALLVATNPCFVSRQDWSCAVDARIFDEFARNLSHNQEKTIQRFLALQVNAVPAAMRTVRALQASLQKRGAASAHALTSGLNMLLDTDLRQSIKTIDCPLHWYLGARDSLVPVELVQALAQEFKQKNVVTHPDAGHAPFISHKDDFVQHLLGIAESLRYRSQNNLPG